ncbi:hypothetical protein AGLY_005357 [Aphis glycines]|uniref:Uncharacterized protein n=1 Tax=Aphis glycines TaxID=307491 RepID=A0A6G0TWH0_APHGL|nr:hypothetical protein AGLY_005357 [Aphis glycines]
MRLVWILVDLLDLLLSLNTDLLSRADSFLIDIIDEIEPCELFFFLISDISFLIFESLEFITNNFFLCLPVILIFTLKLTEAFLTDSLNRFSSSDRSVGVESLYLFSFSAKLSFVVSLGCTLVVELKGVLELLDQFQGVDSYLDDDKSISSAIVFLVELILLSSGVIDSFIGDRKDFLDSLELFAPRAVFN